MNREEVVLCISLDDFYKRAFGLEKPIADIQRKIFTSNLKESPFISKSDYYLGNIKPIWKRRGGIEQDFSMLQIIPYVIVRSNEGRYLIYKRSGDSGDSRLFNNYSAGLGGHVKENTDNFQDGQTITNYEEILRNCAYRELLEELTEANSPERYPHTLRRIGCLYFPLNEIDCVHFCMIYLFEVSESSLSIGDFCTETASKMSWLQRHEVLNLIVSPNTVVETWTKIIFEYGLV